MHLPSNTVENGGVRITFEFAQKEKALGQRINQDIVIGATQ